MWTLGQYTIQRNCSTEQAGFENTMPHWNWCFSPHVLGRIVYCYCNTLLQSLTFGSSSHNIPESWSACSYHTCHSIWINCPPSITNKRTRKRSANTHSKIGCFMQCTRALARFFWKRLLFQTNFHLPLSRAAECIKEHRDLNFEVATYKVLVHFDATDNLNVAHTVPVDTHSQVSSFIASAVDFMHTIDPKWTVALVKVLNNFNAPDYAFGSIVASARVAASAEEYSFHPQNGLNQLLNVKLLSKSTSNTT